MVKYLQGFKRIILLAIAIFAISMGVKAQTWYIMGEYIWSPPHPQGTYEETHFQAEDVEINGMVYHTIYVEGTRSLLGAYRNEDNQVYYCQWNGTDYEEEVLLYDYDLEEGDFFNELDEHPMKVEEVSLITDNNGVQRKKFEFSFIGLEDKREFWIEGVGSSKGFVNCGCYTATSDGAIFHLLCYHVGEDLIYVNPEYSQCDIDDIDENDLGEGIGLYPNPANSLVAISNPNGLAIEKIEIFDVLGRSMLRTDNTEAINVSTLPEGQYFVKITGTSTVVRKLFISK